MFSQPNQDIANLELLNDVFLNSLQQNQFINNNIKKKIKYLIQIIKNKNTTKSEKEKAYKKIFELLETKFNIKNSNIPNNIELFQLNIIKLMDILILISISCIIGSYIPQLKFIKNPIMFFFTLFISIFTRFFADGTINRAITEIVPEVFNNTIEKIDKNDYFLVLLLKATMVALLAFIITSIIYKILLII